LTIRVFIDGELKQQTTTAQLVRAVRRLLADVTEFMTLSPGDILAVGAAAPAPRVRAGQHARIEIDGLGWLENPFVPGTA
jgi:5-oxopent-3-ene-1,2,5-tricarboxylate decarboxylase/2-hydroxyhepta-2,4-diene-1,7-dioate isomerase